MVGGRLKGWTIQRTGRTAQLHKSALSNVVRSPACKPGTGNTRTVSGLFKRKAIVPVSRMMAAIFAAGVSPGMGTVSRPMPHTLL